MDRHSGLLSAVYMCRRDYGKSDVSCFEMGKRGTDCQAERIHVCDNAYWNACEHFSDSGNPVCRRTDVRMDLHADSNRTVDGNLPFV